MTQMSKEYEDQLVKLISKIPDRRSFVEPIKLVGGTHIDGPKGEVYFQMNMTSSKDDAQD